jgi:hypothetical protein
MVCAPLRLAFVAADEEHERKSSNVPLVEKHLCDLTQPSEALVGGAGEARFDENIITR